MDTRKTGEGSSMHAVASFGDNDSETSQTLQRLMTDAWLGPCVRPLKVDPHRAQISDEFMNWCEEPGVEVVDSAGKAKEQQGKVEHHAQLFELSSRRFWLKSNHRRSTSGEKALMHCKRPGTACCQFLVSLRCRWFSVAIQKSQGTSSVTNPT